MDEYTHKVDRTASQILAQRAKELAQALEDETAIGQSLHLITFSLGGGRYAVPVDGVLEIQPLENWARVPCTPSFIVGAVNLRGRIYSLMDVARFFGLPDRPMPDSAHVLLVRGQSAHVDSGRIELCLLADELPANEQISMAEIDRASSTLSSQAQEYTRGVNGEMLIVLDLERLLASAEIIVEEDV